MQDGQSQIILESKLCRAGQDPQEVRQAHRPAPTAALHREGARAALLRHGAHLQARPRVRGHHGGRIRGHAGAPAGTAPVAAVAAAGQGIFRNTVAALVTMGELRSGSSTYGHFSLPPMAPPESDLLRCVCVQVAAGPLSI